MVGPQAGIQSNTRKRKKNFRDNFSTEIVIDTWPPKETGFGDCDHWVDLEIER